MDQLNNIATILAIGTLVMPIVFGYVLYKMSQVFVSKDEWNAWKEDVTTKENDIKRSIEKLSDKLDRLLERK